jgi:hypothetical protein
MNISGQKIPFVAGGAIEAFRLVKVGAADNTAIQATDAAAPIVGVAEFTVAQDQDATVQVSGVARCIAGGVIARGAKLTSDANGAVVTAAPAAGANAHVIGIALASAVAGDHVPVLLAQHTMQG